MEVNKKRIKFRGFNKSNLLNWIISIEDNGFVMCSFKNCNYMAFDIEAMSEHYNYCNQDQRLIKYYCQYCTGGTDVESNLLRHKILHHSDHASWVEFNEFTKMEDEFYPRSNANRPVSTVLLRSWELFLENKKYIKCLVPTCLYLADSVAKMKLHYSHYCTPHYREQLVYSCFTCQGRTDCPNELKLHCETAHPYKRPTNKIYPQITDYWTKIIQQFSWAKCFNSNCNFIDCDIICLKAHYEMCIEPSQEGYVVCSVCQGWLKGFRRVQAHLKAVHNPTNSKPLTYMNPVKLLNNQVIYINQHQVNDTSTSSDKSNRSISNIKNTFLSIKDQEKGEDHKSCTKIKSESKFIDVSSTDVFTKDINRRSGKNSSTAHLEMKKEMTLTVKKLSSLTDVGASEAVEECVDDPDVPVIDCDIDNQTQRLNSKHLGGRIFEYLDDEEMSESDSNDNFGSHSDNEDFKMFTEESAQLSTLRGASPIEFNRKVGKTYNCKLMNKSFPPIYPAYLPKNTKNIDCSKTHKRSVTIVEDILESNAWMLDLTHVSIRTRNRKKKPVNKIKSTLSTLAQDFVPKDKSDLVPVEIKVTDSDKSWTVHVPQGEFKNQTLNELNEREILKKEIAEKKLAEKRLLYKEKFWDSIEAECLNLLNISVQNSSIRNSNRYHSHYTRSKRFGTQDQTLDPFFNSCLIDDEGESENDDSDDMRSVSDQDDDSEDYNDYLKIDDSPKDAGLNVFPSIRTSLNSDIASPGCSKSNDVTIDSEQQYPDEHCSDTKNAEVVCDQLFSDPLSNLSPLCNENNELSVESLMEFNISPSKTKKNHSRKQIVRPKQSPVKDVEVIAASETSNDLLKTSEKHPDSEDAMKSPSSVDVNSTSLTGITNSEPNSRFTLTCNKSTKKLNSDEKHIKMSKSDQVDSVGYSQKTVTCEKSDEKFNTCDNSSNRDESGSSRKFESKISDKKINSKSINMNKNSDGEKNHSKSDNSLELSIQVNQVLPTYLLEEEAGDKSNCTLSLNKSSIDDINISMNDDMNSCSLIEGNIFSSSDISGAESVKVKSNVCSDGIHCGTDDESDSIVPDNIAESCDEDDDECNNVNDAASLKDNAPLVTSNNVNHQNSDDNKQTDKDDGSILRNILFNASRIPSSAPVENTCLSVKSEIGASSDSVSRDLSPSTSQECITPDQPMADELAHNINSPTINLPLKVINIKKELDEEEPTEGMEDSEEGPSGSNRDACGQKRKLVDTVTDNEMHKRICPTDSSSNSTLSQRADSASNIPSETSNTKVQEKSRRKRGRPKKRDVNLENMDEAAQSFGSLWGVSLNTDEDYETASPSMSESNRVTISSIVTPMLGSSKSRSIKQRQPYSDLIPDSDLPNEDDVLPPSETSFTPIKKGKGRARKSRALPEDVIIPDQDFSNLEASTPVPAELVNVSMEKSFNKIMTRTSSEGTPVPRPVPARQRAPRNNRAMDVLNSLGDRISPISFLGNPNKRVTCALCQMSMTAFEYQTQHQIKHNFICWLVNEKPLPLTDVAVMNLVVNRGKRMHPTHVLRCEKCNTIAKSGSGFLSHIQFCGKSKDEMKSLMVPCPTCQRLYKPHSLEYHMRQAHRGGSETPSMSPSTVIPQLPNPTATTKFADITGILNMSCYTEDQKSDFLNLSSYSSIQLKPDKVDTDLQVVANKIIPKKIREGWREALDKGSPVFCPITNCGFRCEGLDAMKTHYLTCNPQLCAKISSCKFCAYKCNVKELFVQHMKNEHCTIVNLGENTTYSPIKYLKDLEDEVFTTLLSVRFTVFFHPCLRLTRELREKIYSPAKEVLHPDIRVIWNNWSPVREETTTYNPVYQVSPAFKYSTVTNWCKLPVYGSMPFKEENLCWTGGSIRSAAWCPTPLECICTQYLAVSCQINFQCDFLHGTAYKHPATIQLWNYGLLLNCGGESEPPKISYILCLDEGPIWDIEWCPSGCYDATRLGLLACSTGSGAIHIYAMPHPTQMEDVSSYSCPQFKGAPSLKLVLNKHSNYLCRKISWSKVKPHKIIVGGFSNGLVAVWDITITSMFLREGSMLFPCRIIQAHFSEITCLRMCPVDNDFVLTGALDKYVKVWDFKDTSYPIQSVSRGCITDSEWLTFWLGFASGLDAGCLPSPSTVFLTSIRDFSFQPTALIGHSSASVMSISSCDWLNTLATAYEDGNVILTTCLRQYGEGSEAKKKVSKFLMRTCVEDLESSTGGKSSSDKLTRDSSSFDETINMFGLNISLAKSLEDKKMENVEEPRHDIYPIHCITKVCFNPNAQSFMTLAICFESGFISAPQLSVPKQFVPAIQAVSAAATVKTDPNID